MASPHRWDATQDVWRFLLKVDNSARDWAEVGVVLSGPSRPGDGDAAIRAALSNVRGCHFDGPCVIVVPSTGAHGRLWQSRFDSCIVSTSATIEVSSLRRAVVQAGATISHCGNVGITATAYPAKAEVGFFAEPISLGDAMGGRPAPLCDTLTLADYAALVRFEPGAQERIASAVKVRSATVFGARLPALGSGNGPDAAKAISAGAPGLASLLRDGLAWPFCDFGPGALFVQCPEVERCVTRGPVTAVGASLSGCVAHALPGLPTVVRSGASVHDSVLHPGVSVSAAAAVRRAVLLTCSGADRAATVAESVLAAGSVAEAIEVSHSLVGPHVALHHSSLLIAALWPEGRGNVAYGANVGSNHTGKLADQEALPGEGTFFGLSTAVKFPVNLRAAPYTLVAAGVATLPQRVGLPFSLIALPGAGAALVPGLSLAVNELTPGWQLSDNAYSVHRSELKHAERHAALARAVAAASATPSSASADGKAGSGEAGADAVANGYAAAGASALPPFDAAILTRPDIADAVLAGRAALLAAKPPRTAFPAPPPKAAPAATAAPSNSKPAAKTPPAAGTAAAAAASGSGSGSPAISPLAVYTDAEIPALGKSFCTERARQAGIRAYTRALRYYVLAAASSALAAGAPVSAHASALGVSEGIFPAAVAAAPAGTPLAAALGSAAAVATLLDAWAALISAEATAVRESKARDSDRGRRIVPDYDAAHVAPTAETDSTVRALTRRAEAAARAAADARAAAGPGKA